MKVKTCGHTFSGSALNIVKELGKFYLFEHIGDVDGYMCETLKEDKWIFRKKYQQKCQEIEKGVTLEQRCRVFIKILDEVGFVNMLD